MAQLDLLKSRLGLTDTSEDTLLIEYLDKASEKILNRLYSLVGRSSSQELSTYHEKIQLDLAEYYYLKRGAEGESMHNENGINRTYTSNYEDKLLADVIPFAKVF